MNDAFPRCAVLGSSCRLLQLEAHGPRPVWAVLDAAGTRRFTGELTLGTSPNVVVWFDGGEAYFASRDGDAPIDEQLLAMGVISADDLAAGTVELGSTRHLGRLFDRVPDLDRDRLELALELLTGDVLGEVADRLVDDVTVASYRHHPSGVMRWTKRPTVVVSQMTPRDEPLDQAAEPATQPGDTEVDADAHVDVDAEPERELERELERVLQLDETRRADDTVWASEPALSWPAADFDVEMPPAPESDDFATVPVACEPDITSSHTFGYTGAATATSSTFDQPKIVWDIPTLPPVLAGDASIGQDVDDAEPMDDRRVPDDAPTLRADTGLVMPTFDIGGILREVSEDGGSNDDPLDISTVDEDVRAAVRAALEGLHAAMLPDGDDPAGDDSISEDADDTAADTAADDTAAADELPAGGLHRLIGGNRTI